MRALTRRRFARMEQQLDRIELQNKAIIDELFGREMRIDAELAGDRLEHFKTVVAEADAELTAGTLVDYSPDDDS